MKREIEIELLSANEAFNLVRRRPNFAKLVAGLYFLSLFGEKEGRLMRSSYLPVRFIDDLLDGDAKMIGNPLHYSLGLMDRIKYDTFNNSPIDRLLDYSIGVLESKANPNDNPRQNFVDAIGAIIFDHNRAPSRLSFSEKGIENYYRKAFDPVLDITFIGLGSRLRIKDIPILSTGQGLVYTARDLDTDWARGIINIPKQILFSADLNEYSPIYSVKNNPLVTEWFNRELKVSGIELQKAQTIIKGLGEKRTEVVINSLISPMLKFIDKFLLS